MTRTPEQIAASLTKAQRNGLEAVGHISFMAPFGHKRAILELEALGLIDLTGAVWPIATCTPLGQQVRDIIKEQENG